MKPELSAADMKAFEPEAKIGLLATLDADELPHVSLITSLRAKTKTQLMWGQFTEGRSKTHVRANPRVGFVVMTADRELWRGKARWTHTLREGDDYELFNHMPMFRYNSYLGIHTVHYMQLVGVSPKTMLSLPRLAGGLALTALLGRRARLGQPSGALKPWAEAHLRKPSSLHYFSYRDEDGYPTIVPVVPCRAVDSGRLVFAPTVYSKLLKRLRVGQQVAVFSLNLEMQSVLVRGTFAGYRRELGALLGAIDIDWVYNSMPPLPGQIYPVQPLQPVTDF